MRIPRRILQAATVGALVVTALGLAGVVTAGERSRTDRREAERLAQATAVVGAVMDNAVDGLDAGGAVFDASDRVTRDEFWVLARRLLASKPTLTAVAFMDRVPAARRAAYERRRGGPILDPPRRPGGPLRPAAARSVHYPVAYLVTRGVPGAYRGIDGLDVSGSPETRASFRVAAATGTSTVSAPLRLVGQGPPAVLVYRPVPDRVGRRAAPRRRAPQPGFLVGAFRLDLLESHVRAALPPGLALRVRDLATGRTIIGPDAPPGGAARELRVEDRAWEVAVAAHGHGVPQLAFVLGGGGIALAALLALLFAAAGRRERYVRAEVEARTAELRAERDYSRGLVASMQDGVYVLDRDGTLLSVNDRLCQMTGFSPRELVGRRAPHPFRAGWSGALLRSEAEFLAAGRRGEMELTFRRRDGERFPVILSAAPLHDAEGALVGGVRVVRDISRQKAAERALEQERDRFRALAADAPVGIWESDAAGAVTFANRRWCEILRMSEQEGHGGGWAAAVHPDDLGRVAAEWERCAREGSEYAIEARLRRPDGSVAWVAAHAQPVADVDGALRGHIGVLVDVTERRAAAEALQASEERVRSLLEFAPDAMIVVDDAGTITFTNAQVERVFGYARDELLGRPIETLVPERDRAEHARHRGRYSAAPVARPMGVGLELLGRRRDGREFPIDVSIGPLSTPEGTVTVAAVRDVSERHALEKAKDEFVAIASHELRTPLTSVLGYLQLVLEEWGDELSPEVRRCLDVAERRGEDLLSLVDDMLAVARADAVRLEIRMGAVDLVAVARQALATASPVAQERAMEIELVAPDGLAVRGDAERLGQVVDNLLSNALKFTPAGGRVTVRLRRRAGIALLEVEDTGIGISEKDQARVFERFFRAESAGREAIPGTGLGLALARMIVEAHGGGIAVESREGQGTTFRVSLPAVDAAPGRSPREASGMSG